MLATYFDRTGTITRLSIEPQRLYFAVLGKSHAKFCMALFCHKTPAQSPTFQHLSCSLYVFDDYYHYYNYGRDHNHNFKVH